MQADESLKHWKPGDILRATRTLSLLWAVLGAAVVLAAWLTAAVAAVTLHLNLAVAVAWVVYAGVWTFTALMVHSQVPSWTELVERGQRTEAGTQMTPWMVLGLVFGVLVGALPLFTYLHLEAPMGSFPGVKPRQMVPPQPSGAEPQGAPVPGGPTRT